MLRIITANELLPEVRSLLAKSSRVSILTAYLSKDAVTQVFDGSNTPIELVTSFYHEFVDASGLELLLSIKAKVYIHTGAQFFHPKVYLFHCSPKVAIVGSSNFTLGGLHNNFELNVITDEAGLTKSLHEFVEQIKVDPVVGVLTPEALSKYAEIEVGKKGFIDKLPDYSPQIQDHSELQRLLHFPNRQPVASTSIDTPILKLRLSTKGQHSREMWAVVWLTDRKNIVSGRSQDFFPAADQEFQIQFSFSGHEFPPIRSHITYSRQISGLPTKLRRVGFKLKPGDILCFQQLEPKRLYRFWIEQDTVHKG